MWELVMGEADRQTDAKYIGERLSEEQIEKTKRAYLNNKRTINMDKAVRSYTKIIKNEPDNPFSSLISKIVTK